MDKRRIDERRSTKQSRADLRFLITAGPTREYIDPVRYLSNDSSGRMGFALAAAALARGHAVTLLHGPVALKPPHGARTVAVVSAGEMHAAAKRLWPAHDVLIMAAAVADYTPATRSATKRKKSPADLTLRLKPTRDILAALALTKRGGQITIGFALEDTNERRNAENKMRQKNLDAIVLNRPTAIGAERSAIEVLSRGRAWRVISAAKKEQHAERIVRIAETLANA